METKREDWEPELLDWVTACQSAYHIENTPGHRFGALPGVLEANRADLVEYVRELIASTGAQTNAARDVLAERHRQRWKPTTSRRDLVKAAALILAEIERLDRAADDHQHP